MSTSDTVSGGKPTNYGFGLAPGSIGTHRMVQHGGGINGFNTAQLWFPDDSLRVVVFTNTVGANPDRLAMTLASAVLGLPLPAAPTPARVTALPATQRARYEGVYDLRLPTGQVLPLHIVADTAGLTAQADGPGQGKIRLDYLGDDTFGAAFDPSMRLTVLFESTHATRLRLQQGGGTVEGPRRP
jgi:hypothetical protein